MKVVYCILVTFTYFAVAFCFISTSNNTDFWKQVQVEKMDAKVAWHCFILNLLQVQIWLSAFSCYRFLFHKLSGWNCEKLQLTGCWTPPVVGRFGCTPQGPWYRSARGRGLTAGATPQCGTLPGGGCDYCWFWGGFWCRWSCWRTSCRAV